MATILKSLDGIYCLKCDDVEYISNRGEHRDAFITRCNAEHIEKFCVCINDKEMLDYTHFSAARAEASHEIEFIRHIGRETGRLPARRDALKKIIYIIDLYNEGDYEEIADINLLPF